jgi:hypothetical protein
MHSYKFVIIERKSIYKKAATRIQARVIYDSRRRGLVNTRKKKAVVFKFKILSKGEGSGRNRCIKKLSAKCVIAYIILGNS